MNAPLPNEEKLLGSSLWRIVSKFHGRVQEIINSAPCHDSHALSDAIVKEYTEFLKKERLR